MVAMTFDQALTASQRHGGCTLHAVQSKGQYASIEEWHVAEIWQFGIEIEPQDGEREGEFEERVRELLGRIRT